MDRIWTRELYWEWLKIEKFVGVISPQVGSLRHPIKKCRKKAFSQLKCHQVTWFASLQTICRKCYVLKWNSPKKSLAYAKLWNTMKITLHFEAVFEWPTKAFNAPVEIKACIVTSQLSANVILIFINFTVWLGIGDFQLPLHSIFLGTSCFVNGGRLESRTWTWHWCGCSWSGKTFYPSPVFCGA